ncbi:unnamed protein product [Paramecium primaurelia]|uniref:Uncharacterized protein n=1 Tax=Paramecium primaurelia TaxID=5886 RepID=A0A8S1P5H5_PARPR|nr:unnamed protein product [Paramecium primaurelia]
MSLDNSNYQDQQEDIRSNDYLSEFQYKKNRPSQKEWSNRTNKPLNNNTLKQQIPSEFLSKPQSQKEAQIQHQKNDTIQLYPSQKANSNRNSLAEQEKQEIQFQLNQKKIKEEQENQIQSQVRKNSQLKIQPVFNINIQITKIYPRSSKSLDVAYNLQYRKEKELKQLKPNQQIQSNIFSSQSREIINRSSNNQTQISDFDKVNSMIYPSQSQLRTYEMRLGMQNDPKLQEKQDILSDIHEQLKQFTITSSSKKHSILEDALQLCLLLLPDLRGFERHIISKQFYEKMKCVYQLERNYQAFVRRFYHLSIFSESWTLQNISKMGEIIMKNQQSTLQSYHIIYNIKDKTIEFPSQNSNKKIPEKPKAIQQIIQNQQTKRIVLSLTTKTLSQYVNLSAKEIDEDIQEFDDELQFVEMILKLIPLAL